KKIILGVTGSIAAYKSLMLVRLLVKEGASVKVIITPAARDFVTPLSLSTLSRNPVLTDLVRDDNWINHVDLGRWADCMLIAPLSANTLAKMATGLCDNLLLATYLSAACPVIVAPAMDEDMWRHPSTQANLERIRSYGNTVIPVEKGELASGLNGEGRMAEPGSIMSFLQAHLEQNKQTSDSKFGSADVAIRQDLSGKRALVTAGPTYEAIDPVRFIGNHSSGKMGLALARALAERGAAVDLVLGPSSLDTDFPGITVKRVQSAGEMYEACLERFPHADLAIMAAAVADYSPVAVAADKIKKNGDTLILELKRTKDILAALGAQKRPGQVLVGFALESAHGRDYALSKLKTKRADLIVLNSLADEGAGFGIDTNKITIFGSDGAELPYERKPKQQVARDIVDRAVKILYA
ncbi:MAG: bifunctional phosphopantothenoylcysteine decarboxylase/phosphopantothenate--cysteine ligase CoaBC, partial [Bacteroidota bacterium]|nr:bifunctional phosphopantothenoylcysteine decarboxylase/phosphopantothenate--cysteine ligase CoaBC [Bacteroidota bacterium]